MHNAHTASTGTAARSKSAIVLGGLIATAGLVFALGGAQTPAVADEASSAGTNIDAAQWAETYPLEYNSYWQSIYPETNGVQAGYTWDEKMGKPAAGLAAIKSGTQIGAGCVSCHSTSFITLSDEVGGDVTTMSADELKLAMTEGITCYSCHEDTPGQMVVSKDYITEAAAAGGIETDAGNLVCAQCHALPNRAWTEELGSTAEDRSFGVMGSTDTATWSTLAAGTDAEAVYQWFLDQGVKDPKVVVGEMEFNQYYGSTMDMAGATCADCHMESATAEDGTTYTRHAWQGANVNTAIYENCLTCHTDATADDMQAATLEVQTTYQEELAQVGKLVDAAQSAIELSDADDETIQAATDLWYKARFFYRYGMDSSEGIHGMGNANTDYCWDSVRTMTSEIIAMV